MKKVAVGTALTDTGKALMAGNRFVLAFEEIENLSSILVSLPPFSKDKTLLAYRHLILSSKLRLKKDPENMNLINSFTGSFTKMKDTFLERILEEDLTFFQENQITIIKAKTQASLPLSAAYEWCLANDENKLNDLECTLLVLFKHLQDPDSPAGKKLAQICAEFKKTEKELEGQKAVSNIVKKVKQMGGKDGITEQPQTADVMKIVQVIMGGGEDGDIGTLAQGILSGKTTIPDLVKQVQSAVQEEQEEDDQTSESQPESHAEDVD
jgi:hypothetical protein